MNLDIKNCPFCGKPPESFPSGDGTGTMIQCIAPGCVNPSVSYYGDGAAAAVWNTRPPDPALQAEGGEGLATRLAEYSRAFAMREQDWPQLSHLLSQAADALQASASLCVRMGEALKPFAEMGSLVADDQPDEDRVTIWEMPDGAHATVSVGDFRRALAALKDVEPCGEYSSGSAQNNPTATAPQVGRSSSGE
jgi:hypothetical protein